MFGSKFKWGGNSLIIDTTIDQYPEITEKEKVYIRLRSDLDKVNYVSEKIETDEDLKNSSCFDRYEKLKRRYSKIQNQEEYYTELFKSNIYLLGSVASGKSDIGNKLSVGLPFEVIDVGNIFRLISLQIISNSSLGINSIFDFKDLNSEDKTNLIGKIQQKSNSIRDLVQDKIDFKKDKKTAKQVILFDNKILDAELRSKKVTSLVSLIAKLPSIRNLVWGIIGRYSSNCGGIILTGHSLKDIDTSKYNLINLTVDKEVAVDRILQREGNNYDSRKEASDKMNERNNLDGWDKTEKIIENVFAKKKIDTTELNPQQIKFRILRNLVQNTKEKLKEKQLQSEIETERKDFNWNLNPLLAYIRESCKNIILDITEKYKENGVTEFDLITQTMIYLSVYPTTEIWQNNYELVVSIEKMIENGDYQNAENLFINSIKQNKFCINQELVQKVANEQAIKLINIYTNTSVIENNNKIELPYKYMNIGENSPFRNVDDTVISKKNATFEKDKSGKTIMIVQEKITGKKIIFKPVSKEIATLYGKGFHYLHKGRSDNFADYGAYLEGDNLPFVWVSYSSVDRKYKKEMLNYLKLEPHRFLEMTRAWNSTWSPKNTMSVLFEYAHTIIKEESRNSVQNGETDKPIQGILTAINPNLGFKASGFIGIGMEVCGLKPANFSFFKDGGIVDYMPRREIQKLLNLDNSKELILHPKYQQNIVPLMPTYELILAFDSKEQSELTKKPIYKIPKSSYQN